ncbi:hypothetical protein GDO78_012152 [Eleutherodactylus coqui]|nr:hypothetical protein GDO78_012152 [Eleutherodactylus coqui]
MPISSGAEGHVGVGVDRSIKWVPEGADYYQAMRIKNSYLQRYLILYGCEEKIKREEMIKESLGPQRIQNTQNRGNTKEGSDMYLTEQRRNKSNTVQEHPIRGTNGTMYTPENSRKTREDDSYIEANGTHMKVTAAANSPAKKSKVCVIL